MKNFFTSGLVIVLVVFASYASKAQCASFTYSIGLNNSVTFFAVASPSNAATSFTWNFGAGNLAPVVATGTLGLQTSVTYSAPGVYTINFASSSCTPGISGVVIVPTCSVSISTANATGSLCSGAATVNYSGFCGTPTISWSNGGNTTSQFSLCPGPYTVAVTGSNQTCCPVGTATTTVGSVTPCVLVASFSRTLFANGVVNFSSTSTGTTASSFYLWEYGDGSANGTGLTSTHTYTANGPFNSFLTVINNSLSCIDTSNVASITPSFCTLSASISSVYQQTQNTFSFNSNAAGTNSASTYLWNFGDGNTATGASTTHIYANPGTYTVGLFINNNSVPTCSLFTFAIINVPCVMNAAFTHTVGTSGLVAFTNQSTGTSSNTSYSWDFGDGYGDISPNTFHQYTNAGTHYIKFATANGAFCSDTVLQAINITGVTCSATAAFSVLPGQGQSEWLAVPYYPYNVTAATWNWGDGSTSNTLYASHIYSVAGNYSICLSVTVSCNATGSYCYSQYFSKPAPGGATGPVYVNVVPQQLKLGIASQSTSETEVVLFPNPASESLFYKVPASLSNSEVLVLDVSGRELLKSSFSDTNGMLSIAGLQSGLYFVVVNGNGARITKQIIIEKK